MHRSAPGPKSTIALAGGVAVTAALATTLVSGVGPAGAATHHYFAYGGNAYGSHVALGTLVNVGKTAYVPMCTTKPGAHPVNKTAKVDLGAVGYIGAVTSGVRSRLHGSTARSAASTHTAHTSLLTGMIKLGAVTTYATVAQQRIGLQHQRQLDLRRSQHRRQVLPGERAGELDLLTARDRLVDPERAARRAPQRHTDHEGDRARPRHRVQQR